MDPGRSTGDRSGNSGNYNQEVVGNLQFGEEVPSLVTENLFQQCFESSPESGSYFTALLGLPANEARELLHEPESGESSVISSAAEVSRDQTNDKKTLGLSFACSPTFPSNAALVERAARFSIFATGKESPETSSMPSNSGENLFKLKNEQTDADSNHDSSQRGVKRKEREKNKGKVPAKKSKNTEEGRSALGEEGKGGEQLPYVHVRARRGQATDSHSLAERARREKINARMKLLQELVPGCNKISGTALVLEEIINHVQSLQRQVEILSMRLATVNPRIDFRGLDNFLSPQNGFLSASNGEGPVAVEPSFWTQLQVNEARQQQQQQLWAVDLLPPSAYERDNNVFITPETSLFSYDSANSVSLHSNQLKMEL